MEAGEDACGTGGRVCENEALGFNALFCSRSTYGNGETRGVGVVAGVERGDTSDFGIEKQAIAETVGQGAEQSVVAFTKRLQRRTLARSVGVFGAPSFQNGEGAAKDAAFGHFCFVENGKCRAETEFFGIASVNAGDKRADKTIEKGRREFATDEIGYGFVGFGSMSGAEKIAKDREASAAGEKRGEENAWAHGNVLQLSVEEHEARGFGGGDDALIKNTKIAADRSNAGVAAETLRATFDEETIALDGLDYAAGTRGCFQDKRGDA